MESKLDKFLQPKYVKKRKISTLQDLIHFQKEHTKLMNIVLNLAYPDPKFPKVFYDLGYRTKRGSIEATIKFKDKNLNEKLKGKGLTPDIILSNEEKEHPSSNSIYKRT